MSSSKRLSADTRAKKRWKLLGNVLRNKKRSEASDVSVMRFKSFNLLRTRRTMKEGDFHPWYIYDSPYCPGFEMKIRFTSYCGKMIQGNIIGVWPAEEVMSYYVLKNKELFKEKSVCELGGGMTSLAGVALSSLNVCQNVLLTDGNEESVKNCEAIIQENKSQFTTTCVSSRLLRWGAADHVEDLKETFDVIIAADCVFFDEARKDLVATISHLLKPHGKGIMFSPRRGTTLEAFVELAEESHFIVTLNDDYDSTISNLHSKNLQLGVSHYDPDLHYPLMLTLEKVTKESS